MGLLDGVAPDLDDRAQQSRAAGGSEFRNEMVPANQENLRQLRKPRSRNNDMVSYQFVTSVPQVSSPTLPIVNIPINAFDANNVRFDEGKVRRAPIFRTVKSSLGFSPWLAVGVSRIQGTTLW